MLRRKSCRFTVQDFRDGLPAAVGMGLLAGALGYIGEVAFWHALPLGPSWMWGAIAAVMGFAAGMLDEYDGGNY